MVPKLSCNIWWCCCGKFCGKLLCLFSSKSQGHPKKKHSLKKLFTVNFVRYSVFLDCECVRMDFHCYGSPFLWSRGQKWHASSLQFCRIRTSSFKRENASYSLFLLKIVFLGLLLNDYRVTMARSSYWLEKMTKATIRRFSPNVTNSKAGKVVSCW